MGTLHVVQHVPFEGPGAIALWAKEKGYRISFSPLHEGIPCPEPRKGDLLCVMGGPMNIYDDAIYPWLAIERAWLKEMVRMGYPVVGVCLGAQLLADALGARVFPHHTKEIGWMPIHWSEHARSHIGVLPEETTVLHWHGDTFELPDGAVPIARSAYCPNQGFLYGRCLAFQFHLEAGQQETELMLKNCADELKTGVESIHSAEAIRSGAQLYHQATAEVLRLWLDFWSRA